MTNLSQALTVSQPHGPLKGFKLGTVRIPQIIGLCFILKNCTNDLLSTSELKAPLALMGPGLRKAAHRGDAPSSASCSHSYADSPGTETSTRRPSLQVQKCFYSELLPPPQEPGQTRCVCHSLVIRQRLPAPKISSPHLSPSGEECKCSNSCVYLFPLGQIEAKETTKQSKSQFFPHLHKGYRSRCTVFVSSGCIISSLSFYINNV